MTASKKQETRTVQADVHIPVDGTWQQEHPKDEVIDSDDLTMQEAVRGMAGGERYVKLYRIPGASGGKPRMLADLIPEEFTESEVMNRFGGGRYHARWKTAKGVWLRYPFEIEGEPFPVKRPRPKPYREEEEQDEDEQTIQPLATQAQQVLQGRDSISITDVLTLMNEARREAREDMRMMIEGMRAQQPAPSSIDSALGFVKDLLPIINSGGSGGSEPAPWWVTALTQLKDPLNKLMDTAQMAIQKAGAIPTPQSAGATSMPLKDVPKVMVQDSPAPVQVEPVKEDDMILSQFKHYLPMLLKGAANGTDPELYMDLILDQVPKMFYDSLRTWLLEPGCLDKLADIEPGVRFQAGWWKELQGHLLSTLNEELGDGLRSIQPEPHSDVAAVDPTVSPEPDRPGA